MGEWLTMQTLIAFVLGVLLAGMVRGTFATARGKVAGGAG